MLWLLFMQMSARCKQTWKSRKMRTAIEARHEEWVLVLPGFTERRTSIASDAGIVKVEKVQPGF